jgi:hypothetical protein
MLAFDALPHFKGLHHPNDTQDDAHQPYGQQTIGGY